MKKYKELKFNKKTYTEQYKINQILLEEGFQWFLDCEVEEVRIEIRDKTLIFNSGTFFNGTWKYGVFRDGVWKYGIWEGGVWYNGKWFNGIFQSGIIFDGDFEHGKIEGGEIRGGKTENIVIDPSVIDKREKTKKQIQMDNTVPQGEKITEIILSKYMNKKQPDPLLNSWVLIQKLEELQMSDELRSLVNKYIEKHGGRFSNQIFRGNLHYIIDNIKNPKLIDELLNDLKESIDVTDGIELPVELPIDKIEIQNRIVVKPPVRIYKTMDEYINSKK